LTNKPLSSLFAMALCSTIGLLWAGTASTAPDAIDTELMQALEDNNKDLASNLALQNAQAAQANAEEMRQLLGQVEAFYAAKGNAPDAVDFSRQSLQWVQRIRAQVDAGEFAPAVASATELARSCKSCHNVYKHDR
jgi:hypothetical protein